MHVPVVVIGAGPAGLAMSHHLCAAGVDHVVLERRRGGELVADRALGLAAPAHPELDDASCPATRYGGDDPGRVHDRGRDGRLPRRLPAHLRPAGADPRRRCGASAAPPTGFDGGGRRRATWRADAVVAATGASSDPQRPGARRRRCRPELEQLTGAGSTGGRCSSPATATSSSSARRRRASRSPRSCCASGRQVTVAVGEHVRLPRTYRGRGHPLVDGQPSASSTSASTRWTTSTGPGATPRSSWSAAPSGAHLDLAALRRRGVRLVGPPGGRRRTSGRCAPAGRAQPRRQRRPQAGPAARPHRRARAGRRASTTTSDRRRAPSGPISATRPPPSTWRGSRTVVWATGYRAAYPWLDATALDRRGGVAHDGGVGARPRAVRAGAAVPATPAVEPHRGRRRRRGRAARPPPRPPRRTGAGPARRRAPRARARGLSR